MKKLFTILLLTSFSSLVRAEEGGQPPGGASEGPQHEMGKNFAEVKSHVLSMLDEKIKEMQQAKTCVSNANSKEDMQKCHKEHRAQSGDAHDGLHQYGKQQKQELQDKREEWKSKREEWKKNRKEGDAPPSPPSTDAQ